MADEPMPRYGQVWLEIAEQQYRDLPAELLDPVDRCLTQLVDHPTEDLEATYHERSDQWSLPVGDQGTGAWSGWPPAGG